MAIERWRHDLRMAHRPDKMTDIVERLRAQWELFHKPVILEAADEIEQLRAVLKEIADSGDFSTGSDRGDLVLTRAIARGKE